MTPPRPILKRHPTSPHHRSPELAVHFPPSPSLIKTFATHSPASYDRSPISVSPNACALPQRGCPGRTYLPLDSPLPENKPGNHVHPRSLTKCARPALDLIHQDVTAKHRRQYAGESVHDEPERTPTLTSPPLPNLTPDVSSSESEESDGFVVPAATHGDLYSSSYIRPPISIPNSRSIYSSLDDFLNGPNTPTALAFLPHSPHSLPSPSAHEDDRTLVKSRRYASRRRSQDHHRDTGHDREKSDMDQTRVLSDEEVDGGCYKALSSCSALQSCELDVKDEGCLAGF